jgi:hypothetical protein
MHYHPSVCCVWTPVPEKHPGMTTMLKEFKSHHAPWSTKTPGRFAIAPTVQAIVVDHMPIVNP